MQKKWAYYNEFDPKAAAWLRELIKLGEIMDGEVDERSIADVQPDDVRGFIRVGFFAGIGGWDLALRKAGWPDDRPVWHGSCPCQAFSCAGQQKGFADERDLWPVFFNLIRECRPDLVLGEQVENAVRHGWLDRLYADMEGEDYACGSVVLGAHSAGADHIRQRIYWVADAEKCGGGASRQTGEHGAQRTDGTCRRGVVGGLGITSLNRPEMRTHVHGELRGQGLAEGRESRNFWSAAVPHLCKDGKWRRYEDRIFPLVESVKPSVQQVAHGLPRGMGYSGDPRLSEYVNSTAEARVMRLKGYGNAVNVETAVMFVKAIMDELDGKEVIA